MSFDPAPKAPATRYAYQKAHRRDAADIAARMERTWQFCVDHMALAQAEMERAANKRRTPAPDYKPGDMVFISTKNIKTERPSKKLDYKNIGPYPIVRKVGQASYEVDLPPNVSIHPVFHTSLLRLHANDPLPNQLVAAPPPVVVGGEEEWEVEEILNSRLIRGQLHYRAKWVGHVPDYRYYPASDFDNAAELVHKFHRKYPNKPGPSQSSGAPRRRA